MPSDVAWTTVRDRLLLAVAQELAATREARGAAGSEAKTRSAGEAQLLPAASNAVTATYSVDLRRRTLREDQLDGAYLASAAEAPVRFLVDKVVSCNPAEVQVSVDATAADYPHLQLFTRSDPLALLRGLHESLTQAKDLGCATDLYTRTLGTGAEPLPAGPAHQLNAAQQKALQESLAPGVNIIWGPPGTGKTQLLGTFLAAVATAGRSALLVSNTNVAVDEALLRTQKLLGTSTVGQLVRAGAPSNAAVAQHPHLPLDRAVRILSERLTLDLDRLDRTITEQAQQLRTELEDAGVPPARALLATFPSEEELDRLRQREATHTQHVHQEQTLAETVEQEQELEALRQLRATTATRREAEFALAAIAQRAQQQLTSHRQAVALFDYRQRTAQEQLAAAHEHLRTGHAQLEVAQKLGWWTRSEAVTKANRAIKAAQAEQAVAEEALAQQRRAVSPQLDPHVYEQLTNDTAASSPEEFQERAFARDAAQQGLAEVTHRLDRTRAELKSLRSALDGVAPAPLSAAEQDVLRRAAVEDLPRLRAQVQACAVLEKGFATRRTKLLAERKKVLDAIAKQHPDVIKNCRVLATTTASFAASASLAPARERAWDYVIIDEASACLYPYLAYAATRASRGVTIVGDFLQNGPISAAVQRRSDAPVSRALSGDVFSLLGVSATTQPRPGFTVLDTQYRFPVEVANIANRFGYRGQLQTVHRGLGPTFSGLPQTPVVLVDTSTMADDFQRMRTPTYGKKGSWLAGAAAALELARRTPAGTGLGVVTVYSEQAALTAAALEQHGLTGEVGTAHRYQGREFPLVVFDTSEPDGHHGWSAVAEFGMSDWAHAGARLCNVALTRCQSQIALVVDTRVVKVATRGFLAELRAAVEQREASVVNLAALIAGTNVSSSLDTLAGTQPTHSHEPTFLTETDLYDRLPQVLRAARVSVELWSAFVARRRLEMVLPLLVQCVERGVRVSVHCKPAREVRDGHTNADVLLELLRSAGVQVVEDFGTHEKALLIDDTDGYYGSLNVLSHAGTTSELMIHLSGKEQARAFRATIARRSTSPARLPSRQS